MHVIGSIEKFEGALPAIHFREWDVITDPEPAMHLNGSVYHIAGNPRSDNFDGRDLGLGHLGPTLINHPHGLHCQKTCLLDFDLGLGNPFLDGILIGSLDHHLRCPLGPADGAHAAVDATGTQSGLGDHESVAFGRESVVCEDPGVFELDPYMAVLVLPTEDGE